MVEAIKYIYRLYIQKPKKIVIIGHSMGGIAIQGAIMREDFDRDRIAFIIAFAVPYVEPRYFLMPKLCKF